jgi:hypothetical protein
MNRDLHVSPHVEIAVRALKFDARYRIAERVDLIAPAGGRRGNQQRVFQALLIGGGAGYEVQQMM